MLGIIFTGGEPPAPDTIKQMLENKGSFSGTADRMTLHSGDNRTLIIAADSGLDTAESAGIKPDIIIGDMDSIDEKRLLNYPAECVMRHERNKDYTDTELALIEALKRGCSVNWLIGGGGGRADHFFAIRSLFERVNFPVRWITKSSDIYCLEADSPYNSLSYCIPNNIIVSVFPLGCGPWLIKSSGLNWPLDNYNWKCGLFSLSNFAVDAEFSVAAEKGRFLVILSNDIGG